MQFLDRVNTQNLPLNHRTALQELAKPLSTSLPS